jgi:L-methionine (R)-S-oxide reductase
MSATDDRAALHRTDYALLERQAASLLEGERDFIANAANFAALLFNELSDINWAGFYFPDEEGLVLGPFGGKPACTRLPNGRGVCGAAFAKGETVIIDDVDAFPDHIVCDSASRSEIVIPLLVDGEPVGVFDIDSPLIARFDSDDRAGLESVVAQFLAHTIVPDRYRRRRSVSARLNERIDIQTCREHHVVIGYLADELANAELAPETVLALLKRLRSVLMTHLRLEDDWLYPRLQESKNEIVQRKAEHYRSAMGDLKEHFVTLWQTWSENGAIARHRDLWQREWRIFDQALRMRIEKEDHDLYVSAEADLGA